MDQKIDDLTNVVKALATDLNSAKDHLKLLDAKLTESDVELSRQLPSVGDVIANVSVVAGPEPVPERDQPLAVKAANLELVDDDDGAKDEL